jgi:hypothetical protein
LAANEAVVEWAGTIMLAGTVTAVLLLVRATFKLFVEAALNDTVQLVFPAAMNEVFAQNNEVNAGGATAVAGAESEMETDFSMLPCVAVIVPLWSVFTVDTVAANFTLVEPAGTVTEAGTLISAMLLARCTKSPPDGAEVFVTTVQVLAPVPVISAVSQLKALSSAFFAEPFPCNLTEAAGDEEALVITLN